MNEYISTKKKRSVMKLILTRILVIFLMLYLVVMVQVANRGIYGFEWRSSGWSLFPIPQNPTWFGWIVVHMMIPLTPLELFVYLVFVGNGIWIFWEIIAVLFLVYPWSSFLQSRVGIIKSRIITRIRRGR